MSSELGLPRLGSDTIGRTIRASQGIKDKSAVDAYWIAYEVLFRFCEEFLKSGVSSIIDITMGWAFQWQYLNAIRGRYPEMTFLPIILRCPREICIERIRKRHSENPSYYDPPELYLTDPKLLNVWEFLNQIDLPEIQFVDASGSKDEVYKKIRDLSQL